MSRPCTSCMATLKDLEIENIFYTTNDGYVSEYIKNKERKYEKNKTFGIFN